MGSVVKHVFLLWMRGGFVLQQSGFVISDNLLQQPVIAFGIVFRFEILSEYPRYGLPESRYETSPELPQNLECRIVRFPVNEFQQHLTLCAGHVFDNGGVLLLDLLIDPADIRFLLALCRKSLQLGLHLGHSGPGDLCNGIDPFDGCHQLPVAAQIGTPREDSYGPDVDVGQGVSVEDLPLL